MAFSSSLATTLFPLCNSSSISSTPKLSGSTFLSNASSTSSIQFQSPRLFTTRVFAAPEALEQTVEIEDSESSTVIMSSDSEKLNITGFILVASPTFSSHQVLQSPGPSPFFV